MARPTWDTTWFKVAQAMEERAECTRRKVGAVLVKDSHLLECGYNGTPPGELECTQGGCPRGRLSYDEVPADADYNLFPCRAVHAEANCLLRAGRKAVGATLYVTQKPCPQCQSAIMTAGVEWVVWPGDTWYVGHGYIEEL